MIRSPTMKHEIRQKLFDLIDCCEYEEKWKEINIIFNRNMNNKNVKSVEVRANKMEIIFSYVYPRLDVEVSRHVNHLLKSPFCIHPKTGKVCTIIDPKQCDTFDPSKQPTLISLIEEYNKAGKENKNKTNGNIGAIGWRDTRLKNVIQVFRETFLNGLQKERMRIFKMQQGGHTQF